jgi:hypothetical protein
MTLNFCTGTARKIRRLGYAHKVADRISRFCYIFMLFLRGLMGPIGIPSQVLIHQITGSGKFFTGARAGIISPGFSGLRHN